VESFAHQAPSEQELVRHLYRVGKQLGLGQHAWRTREEGSLRTQRDQYEAALASDPSCPYMWCNLGLQGGGEIHTREYTSVDCYQEALERDESYAKAWQCLGHSGGGVVGLKRCSKALSWHPARRLFGAICSRPKLSVWCRQWRGAFTQAKRARRVLPSRRSQRAIPGRAPAPPGPAAAAPWPCLPRGLLVASVPRCAV
jgi:hypothetical protein